MILIVPHADLEKIGLAISCNRLLDTSSRGTCERLMDGIHRANIAKIAAKLNKVTTIVIGAPLLTHMVNQATTGISG